jgi:HD-like signal output (HDOD) protein
VLGVTHDETAERLLEQWHLPRRLIAMVAHHHTPAGAGEFARPASVVHLADILCRAKGFGSGGDDTIPRLDPEAWKRLDLTFGDVEHVMRRMSHEFGPATALLAT